MENDTKETGEAEVQTDKTETAETKENQSPNELAEIKTLLESYGGDIASLKRSMKKATSKPEKTEAATEKAPADDSGLLEKAFLRTASITDKAEVELALETAKKWDMSVDALVDDEDFKIKLEKHRTQVSNEKATSNVKGDQGGSTAKDTAEYWIAKGVPPTREQVPDRKTRAKIARAMMASEKDTKKFYND